MFDKGPEGAMERLKERLNVLGREILVEATNAKT